MIKPSQLLRLIAEAVEECTYVVEDQDGDTCEFVDAGSFKKALIELAHKVESN